MLLFCPTSHPTNRSRILRLLGRLDCRGQGLRGQFPGDVCDDAACRDCVPHCRDRGPARVADRGHGDLDCRAKVLARMRQGIFIFFTLSEENHFGVFVLDEIEY